MNQFETDSDSSGKGEVYGRDGNVEAEKKAEGTFRGMKDEK